MNFRRKVKKKLKLLRKDKKILPLLQNSESKIYIETLHPPWIPKLYGMANKTYY